MGKGSSKTKSKTETKPWEPVQDDLIDSIDAGRKIYESDPNAGYKGPFYVGQSDAVAGAREGIRNFNTGQIGYMNPSIDLLQRTVRGDFLSPESNPWLSGAMDAATAPVERQLMRSTIPALRSRAIASGAYGGNANAVQEGVATGEAARNAMEIRSGMAADNYRFERGNQGAAVQMLPGAVGAAGLPYERLLQDAMLGEQYDQRALDNSRLMEEARINAPWQNLGRWQDAMEPALRFGTQTTKTKSSSSDPMAGLAGGGMLGSMAGMGLNSLLLAGGPPAAGTMGAMALANPWMLPVALAGGGMLAGGLMG